MIRTGFILMALAVVLGAFGAHSLEAHLEPRQLEVWKTAVNYQFIHALGLIVISALAEKSWMRRERLRYAQIFLLLGIVLFSGSLYFLSTKGIIGANLSWLGPVTPLGGVCFIAGWVIAALSVTKEK
jgi:uncharacterized membrane protein YgdD (TMEM256/DUF423 family)